eukprot:543144-Prymnesium_polylepis.1
MVAGKPSSSLESSPGAGGGSLGPDGSGARFAEVCRITQDGVLTEQPSGFGPAGVGFAKNGRLADEHRPLGPDRKREGAFLLLGGFWSTSTVDNSTLCSSPSSLASREAALLLDTEQKLLRRLSTAISDPRRVPVTG